MAGLIKADIEVIDDEYRKLCGVGVCGLSENVISDGAIYREVFKTGGRVYIDNPRHGAVCETCAQRGRCLEQLELAVPIMLNEGENPRVIGAIGLVAGNRAGRDQIVNNARAYIFMLESICGFIAAKAADAARIAALQADLALFTRDEAAAESIRRVDDLQRDEIRRALYIFGEGTAGKRKAANALGIGVATLYRKISSGGDNLAVV